LQPLAGQNPGEFIALPLIHAEKKTDFSGTHPQTTVGDVGILTDVASELGHKTLAEPHGFIIGFSFGFKIGSALGAPMGKVIWAFFKTCSKAKIRSQLSRIEWINQV
jgi:hypothetical protein